MIILTEMQKAILWDTLTVSIITLGAAFADIWFNLNPVYIYGTFILMVLAQMARIIH